MRIVFMGTPDFAVPSLNILVEAGFDIVGVVTATDKYGGRGGKQLMESPVKKYAREKGLNILQPPNLKAESFLDELRALRADLQIVVAFRMLPEAVWDMPPLGTYNLHGSLLPAYRGAAPIHWAVINGETQTGVTSFKLQHAIDTGDLAFQATLDIGENETTGDVHDRMMLLGAEVVLKTVRAIEEDTIVCTPQDERLVSKAPKIFHEDCRIDFNRPAKDVHNFIRGLSPYPGAYTQLDDKEFKILRSSRHHELLSDVRPGGYVSDGKTFLVFRCADGFVRAETVKMAGKRAMDIGEFLNGYSLDGPK